jgi:hypothetical protein
MISSNNTVIKPIPQTDLSSAKFEIENGLLKITDLSYKEMFVNIEPNDRLVINIDKTRNPVDTILSSSVFYEYDIATANEIETTVKRYLPQIRLNNLTVDPSPLNEYAVLLTIDFTITDDIFETSEIIQINL